MIAQQKTLTLKDAVYSRDVYPDRMRNLTWRAETDSYTFIKDDYLMQGEPKKEDRPLLKLEQLNNKLKAGMSPMSRFPSVTWIDDETFMFMHESTVLTYNFKDESLTKQSFYDKEGENVDLASNYSVAFTKKGNLYVCDAKKQEVAQVTSDDGYQVVNGEAHHRVEFGITKGTYWSPSGKKLAFSRMDQSMVTDYPLVDYSTTPAKAAPVKYPMSGQASHHVTIGVYSVKSGKTIFLETGEPKEQYLTNITWGPDEKYIYIAVVNRDQNEMKLNQYDAKKGKFIKTLFIEKHERYVEPEHDPIFLPKSSDEFLWYSERDGYNHLYHYNTEGTLLGQVTKGDWIVTKFLGFDKSGKQIFIEGTMESPVERHLASVDLKSKEMRKLTKDEGMHSTKVSKSGKYVLDTYSNLNVPNVSQLLETKKNETLKELFKADNPVKDFKIGAIDIFTIKADDGTDLYCRMIKPVDFNPTNKYPVMVYVYNGPHVQLVKNQWMGGAQMFLQYMAGQGYIVFTVDGRGSANRGFEFESSIHRQMGSLEIGDQLKGVEYLKQQPFVDVNEMGVFGWSYGGFMATSLMLRSPGTFKLGVAGGPVIDWQFYEVMYTERYMDTPQQNPEGYEKAALTNYVNDLDGKLLIIHGLQDATVVPQHTRAFIRKCVEEGVVVDYFPYPTHPHNVRGKDRMHLMKVVSEYFSEHL